MRSTDEALGSQALSLPGHLVPLRHGSFSLPSALLLRELPLRSVILGCLHINADSGLPCSSFLLSAPELLHRAASASPNELLAALLPKPALVLHELPWWKKSHRCATDSASQHLGAPVSHHFPPCHSDFPRVTQFFPEVLSAHEPFTTRCFAGRMRAT